jgi:putative transposase
MKRSKFSEAQIAFILRQAEEGTVVGEVCRKAGISEATYYNWKKKYAGLTPSEMKRLRQLEEENGKLKKIVADLSLERSTYHYRSRRAGQAQLTERIKEIAGTRVRYGYRRIHVLLRRDGWRVNVKRVWRLYRELGLQLRNKTPKRRVKAKLREDRRPATRTNETWAMDFVHDQLATGTKLRVLTIVDTFSRFSPAIEPRFSFRGADVVEVLERVGRGVGFPAAIQVDQGSEFVSRDLDLWAYQRGVTLDFSRPGKPTDNAFIESFNGKFRAECLNAHWFMSLDDARRKCEAWRRDYNEERPHSAIGNRAPIELANRSAALGPP